MTTIAEMEEQADLYEQFEEIQNPEWGCLPTLEMILSLLSTFFEEKPNG